MVKGIAALVLACTVWGLSPLFYWLLSDIPPLEVLSYRTLWSLVFFAGLLAVQGRLHRVGQSLRDPRTQMILIAASVMISVNWFGFIWSISRGNGLEASLGYYIFPLVSVVLGAVFFGERLGRAQLAAVVLAAVAVSVLTLGLGVPPWIALLLAGTFGVYGVLKKRLSLGAVTSVTAEVAIIAPLAIGWLALRGTTWPGQGADLGTHALLMLSGPLTGLPLILFSYATQHVRLSTVGIVQYLNPSLQFACAVLFFGNLITPWHGIAFPLIWGALVIYSVAAYRQDRARRRAASAAAVLSTTVT
ncbi:chloramphenicol-sensitive protein RarD [Loktanella sp. DSM 29012]|uniref:EamA family transporter RarD n=1 Tax=Loktanella sp. DSM 29012 TaxID=1881056 RepID=UPI0008BD9B9D|nr:EamA family transporter RarD [Loktanella sp. DSM 29012]SEQ18677.1 chloramphenicol-sensitive protein RarD [Loktanella sp. DSM 29012]